MPIHKEGQSAADAWFTEEYAYPSGEAAKEAARVAAELPPVKVRKAPKRSWLWEEVADSHDEPEHAQSGGPESAPGESSDISGHGSDSSDSEDLNSEELTKSSHPRDTPPSPQKSEVLVSQHTPRHEQIEVSQESQGLDNLPTSTRPSSPVKLFHDPSPHADSIETFALLNANIPPQVAIPNQAPITHVEELRRKREQLKKELEMAEIEAEIAELEESLAKLRSGKTGRSTNVQPGNGGREVEINIRVRLMLTQKHLA